MSLKKGVIIMGTPTNRSPAKVRLDMATDPDYRVNTSDMVAIGKDIEVLDAIVTIDIPPYIKELTTLELGNVKRSGELNTQNWKNTLASNQPERNLSSERVAYVMTMMNARHHFGDMVFEVYMSRTPNHWLLVHTNQTDQYRFTRFFEVKQLINTLSKHSGSCEYKGNGAILNSWSQSPACVMALSLRSLLKEAIEQRQKTLSSMTNTLSTIERRHSLIFPNDIFY